MFMPKKPLSVTLEEGNILWLRGRARSGKERSLSEALDTLITAARQSGYGAEIRSAVGTIDVSPEDPDLLKADAAIRKMFDAWLGAQPAMLTSRSTGGRKRTRSRKAANRG
jgi:hypothetical protein